jgi:uncharacterized membrane protein
MLEYHARRGRIAKEGANMKNPLDSLAGTVASGVVITILHIIYMANIVGGAAAG